VKSNSFQQRGVGFVGLLIILAILIFFAVLGMRVAPAVMEFMTIQKTVKRIANEQPAATPQEWRSAFDRFAQIDSMPSVTGKDLIVEKTTQGARIAFAYDKKIPLFGPASLLLEFKGSSSDK
jgi:Domain of unknown function (DUF4845)